jgi:hypothetical protein
MRKWRPFYYGDRASIWARLGRIPPRIADQERRKPPEYVYFFSVSATV